MTRRLDIWGVMIVLCELAACGGGSNAADLDDDGGRWPAGLSDAAPAEAELCEIVFGTARRADVEAVLGEPDTTRETLDRVVMLYDYEGGNVAIALHLDVDVFRDFSVYGASVPECWAQAKRNSNRPRTDAGADLDPTQ